MSIRRPSAGPSGATSGILPQATSKAEVRSVRELACSRSLKRRRQEPASRTSLKISPQESASRVRIKRLDQAAAWPASYDSSAMWATVEPIWTDLRYALRLFRKAPFSTASILLVLAFGLGLHLAVFAFYR